MKSCRRKEKSPAKTGLKRSTRRAYVYAINTPPAKTCGADIAALIWCFATPRIMSYNIPRSGSVTSTSRTAPRSG